MPYCAVVDLLIGDISTSTALSPIKYVADAADEIDSKIGFRYETPVSPDAPRPVILLLKRLNSHLASGRLILAATISANQEELNAYGASLVNDAQLALEAIASGELLLPGADRNAETTVIVDPANPKNFPVLSAHADAFSQVEAFYNNVTNRNGDSGFFTSPYRASSG